MFFIKKHLYKKGTFKINSPKVNMTKVDFLSKLINTLHINGFNDFFVY